MEIRHVDIRCKKPAYGYQAGSQNGVWIAATNAVNYGPWNQWSSRQAALMLEIPTGSMASSAISILKATSWGEAHYFAMGLHGHLTNCSMQMQVYNRSHIFSGRSIRSGGFIQSNDDSVNKTVPLFVNKTATAALDMLSGILTERVIYKKDAVKAGTGYVSINAESVKNSFPEGYEEHYDTTEPDLKKRALTKTEGVDLGAIIAIQMEAIKELRSQNELLRAEFSLLKFKFAIK